ncbi:hypothetical protein DFH06DRAFT_1339989 [Mycena polygramma]|nr:hypothetical protein DFH06DRAFT_1339989 [Mycena polygramma]
MESEESPAPGKERQLTEGDSSLREEIPEEILLAIFRLALPPSWVLMWGTSNPPFLPSIWSADYLTKLSIVGVCKRWHRVGLEFMYESVVLHHIGQLAAFTRTLEARPQLGPLVRRLELCYLLRREYQCLHHAETEKIVELCPRLTDLVFDPRIVAQPQLTSLRPLSVSLGLTNLDVGDFVPYDVVLPILVCLCQTLRTLSISLPEQFDGNHPTINFIQLKNFRLGLCAPFDAQLWVTTALERVSFRPRCGGITIGAYHTAVCGFLHRYGRTVTDLMVEAVDRRGSPQAMQPLLNLCPILRYLRVSESHLVTPLQHKTVCRLDIKSDGNYNLLPEEREFERLRSGFPALRACRYIEGYGCNDFVAYPPPVLHDEPGSPPTVVMAYQSVHFDLPESSWLAMILSEECFGDEGSSEDSDYVFDSEDDDGGSVDDSDTDSTRGDFWHTPADMVTDDAGPEIDRDETLEIFSRTLS